MSILDRIYAGLRNVLALEDRVTRIAAQNDDQAKQLFDHEKRLIRIETMIEMGGRAATPKRLPKP